MKEKQKYISRMEFEKKKKIEEERHGKLKAEEKKKLRELHNMRCPKAEWN